ncbi:MAG TPA: DEAD/DEAH box helicase family protein [Solirubrobacteraceae bacterium]|nr:DEAD/DEAH box helicase family protein [Solirubrobacteraceae bacterium]
MPLFDDLSFGGTWRRYQTAAVVAFERDRKAGRRRTHLIAPPGSGKTLLGVEIVRRIGRRALVLTPNSAIQMQWPRTVRKFGSAADVARTAGPEPGFPIAVMTYQSLCQLDDPAAAIRQVAAARWATDRAAATGVEVEEAEREGLSYEGAAAERRVAEIARITAQVKREIARGEHAEIELAELFSETARKRIDAFKAARIGAIVLDECHHLASMWGYVVRAVLDELRDEDVHVIGLTATPPDDLTGPEQELYAELLGPVDFVVPTPAVVREGHLAPYQELAWLTEPLDSERAWLAEHDTRFKELITTLHDDVEGPLSFPGWVITRLRERRRTADDETQHSWEDFQHSRPELARAGVRFLASAGLELPEGAPHGEAYRRPPDLDDWLVLLEDYALRCLHVSPDPAAGDRYAAVAAALGELGFRLTRRGIRRGTSEVDRLLTGSQAKAIGLVEVLAAEMESRGDGLRALVLCDAELAESKPDAQLGGVLDPAAGTARHALVAVGADSRTAPLRPLVVSGRGLRCLPQDADVLLEALAHEAEEHLALPDWEAAPDGVLISLRSSGAEWVPRAWVEVATRVLESGVCGALIGTRALLGEGWDCPMVNCLVDMTVASTGVSVQQMRGRSLRLNPDEPEKVASNWDVVCVAPDLVRGSADYERFVRKHLHLYAPADDGEIEAGPSHVHAELSPFAPPPGARLAELNRAMLTRAAATAEARERWRIGEPYRGADLRTLVVRRTTGQGSDPLRHKGSDPPGVSQRVPVGVAAAGLVGAVVGALTSVIAGLVALALVPIGLAWAAVRLARAQKRLPTVLPLERSARAVVDAYRDLGEMSDAAAGSLEIEPRASGYLRCVLTEATPEESARFADALDELASVADAPRYLVGRPLPDPDASVLTLLGRVLARRPPFPARHHPVPKDLGRNKERAAAFERAWAKHIGGGGLVFTQRTDEGRRARAEAAAHDGGYETLLRDIWV